MLEVQPYKNFNVIKAADNAIVLTGFNLWKQELKKIGMSGTPLVFGGGNIDLAIMAAELGCCNNAGQDLSLIGKTTGFKFYEDYSDFSTILRRCKRIRHVPSKDSANADLQQICRILTPAQSEL
jgi:hypothetical protein